LVKDTAHGKVGSMSEEIVNDEGRARTLVAVRIQDVNKIPNLYVEPNCAPKSDALGKLDFDRSCLGLNRRLLFVSFPFVLTIVYEGQPGVLKPPPLPPTSLVEGFTRFLENLDVTFRKDPINFRLSYQQKEQPDRQDPETKRRIISADDLIVSPTIQQEGTYQYCCSLL